MKPILDLYKSISDQEYFISQFEEKGKSKNFLFVNPQLSGKHLYKMLLPFYALNKKDEFSTAITYISKYDPEGQLLGGREVNIHPEMMRWADYVIFPFTTQPLFTEIYNNIRNMNPDAKICYQVDFNFYEIYKEHPYKAIFEEPTVISAVEDNMLFSDFIIVSNKEFYEYLGTKLREVIQEKYTDDIENIRAGIIAMPYFIDTAIVMENIDYKPEKLKDVVHEEEEIKSVTTESPKKEETSVQNKVAETTPVSTVKESIPVHNEEVIKKIKKASDKAAELKKKSPKTKKIKGNGKYKKQQSTKSRQYSKPAGKSRRKK